MTEKEHDIVDFWRIGVQFNKRYIQELEGVKYGKVIYRPNNGVFGVDLHWANRLEPGYDQIRMPMNKLYIIHARDYSVIFNQIESKIL
jgi:hypothetical protein